MAPPRLITIPFSHFCEKARWALDRADLAYVEDGHLPLFHAPSARRAGGRTSVPVLVTDAGPVIDSTDILRWADARGAAPPLFPPGDDDVVALEDRFDRDLGPHTRRLAYDQLLPVLRAQLRVIRGAPRREVVAARLTAPLVRAIMRRGLRITPAGVARSRDRVDEVFAEVGDRLADGRTWLCGDRLTAADLTFAALAVPVVMPPEAGAHTPMTDLPDGMLALMDRYRATPAGQFVLRVYATARDPSRAVPPG